MSRIELGETGHKIVQCEHCGRIRLAQTWTWADWVVPDVIGTCATCGEEQRKARILRQRREERRIRARCREGFGPVPEGTDPFRGFRS
jgi:hypothetical protein